MTNAAHFNQPVIEFTDKCVEFGCTPHDFDIQECTTAEAVARLIEQKIDVLKEEFKETVDAALLACTLLRSEGRTTLESVEDIFDGLIDTAFVCMHAAYVLNLPFVEGFNRVCDNNNAKFRGDAHVVNGKLKKPSDHPAVELSDLCVNKWGNFSK